MTNNKLSILEFFSSSKYKSYTYKKNDIIALEGEPCLYIGLVFEGIIDLKRNLSDNNTLFLSSLSKGDLFGEVIAFSDINVFPATIYANSDCVVKFITKDEFIYFCINNPMFLNMFLGDLSNKIITLNKSINNLGLHTVKQKVCFYLLNEYKEQDSNFIKLNMSKSKLSEKLAIPRTSLSRELTSLKNLKVIDYSIEYIKILDINYIKDVLNK